MVDEEKQKFYKQKHEINIALASQMRLHDLLNRIAFLDANNPIDSPQKQKSYLNLVKQYFISAVPYLSPEDSEKYKKEILSFRVNKKSGVKRGTQTLKYEFDPELDFRLNEILIELQQRLRHIFSKVRDDEEEGL